MSDSLAILVFPRQTSWQYSDGVGRNRDSEPISGFIACCQRCDRPGVINTAPPDRSKLTLIAGSERRSLLMAEDDDKLFMTRSPYVTPKTTEQYLIVRSDKSVSYVTNNKRLCSTLCTIEDNYWLARGTRGLFAIAELLVHLLYDVASQLVLVFPL